MLYPHNGDRFETIDSVTSPHLIYNTTQCVEWKGEYLYCYSNKTESVVLRKCPYDHRVTNKACLSAITVTNLSQLYLRDGGKNQLAYIWNQITSLSPMYSSSQRSLPHRHGITYGITLCYLPPGRGDISAFTKSPAVLVLDLATSEGCKAELT